jgi:hypothetical protein
MDLWPCQVERATVRATAAANASTFLDCFAIGPRNTGICQSSKFAESGHHEVGDNLGRQSHRHLHRAGLNQSGGYPKHFERGAGPKSIHDRVNQHVVRRASATFFILMSVISLSQVVQNYFSHLTE